MAPREGPSAPPLSATDAYIAYALY